jgi:tetratricopeptide (TPR) repeat protein
LAHLAGDAAGETRWRERALSGWATNPAVDHLIGRRLSQDYRFAEGAAAQRRALQFAPDFTPAKIQLSQDLLRLGQETEGWQLAEEVYRKDGYHVVAHNLVTLRERLAEFKTLACPGFVVRMEELEADLYGQAALELLQEAKRVLCAKYDVELQKTVAVEIFPEQKDFAIRTFGLPGGAGFLGVCFGPVITANSPASQGEHPANWKAMLWHEFCHVVTLHKTKNKMPRWLSEGISVYEERQADPSWGESMDAIYRNMVLGGDLTPVSQLSGAFLQPPSPVHLQFAYYESSLVVEYLVEKHGLATLKKILVDLAADTPINVALQRHVTPLETLDAQFAAFARQRAEGLAAGADWEPADLPADSDAEALAEWNRQHPNNLAGLRLLAAEWIKQQQWQKAQPPLEQLIHLYPEDTSADNGYRLLARVHQELKDASAERAVLEKLAALDDDAVDVYRRLSELCEQAEDWQGVARNAERILAVNPLLRAPHRELAQAAERLGDRRRAIQAYRAVLRLDPTDPAETHYRLAQLLKEQGDLTAARRQVLMALEEAPRFRDAHRLLLELVEGSAAESAKVAQPDPKQEAKP